MLLIGLRTTGLTVALLCASLGFGQSTVERLNKSRASLPVFAAVYEEKLEVPNSKPNKDNESFRSWGDRNSTRFLLCGFSSTTSYIQEISSATAVDEENSLAMTFLSKLGDKNYVSTSSATQGNFGAKPSGFINPASRHFEIRIGETWADRFAKMELVRSGPTELYKHRGMEMEVTLDTENERLCISKGSSLFEGHKTIWEITEWQKVGDFKFPKVLKETRFDNGVLVQTFTYTLIRVLGNPAKYTKLPEWQQGALVKDTDTEAVYVYKNGKFEVDPRFLAAKQRGATWTRIGIILGFIAVGSLFTFLYMRRLRARRSQASP
ncbi:MAG: hypothetical protein JST35_07445 [Armatimonadetes bacterium]|nr:hypothetical protein [Armatimonadota bacterium]